ncbi:hypothetical protein [Streptomyces afghaniensis]|uniref:hypothetical protein n=1 Tax=Streptomyces afghaniensis TaxID=66865 RepID=UPI0027837DA2|nr:hypothetical protein [Streptomyces afghaniensis]MDQ1014469.1 hypothetical protein [Streptomyces afghaniensis]
MGAALGLRCREDENDEDTEKTARTKRRCDALAAGLTDSDGTFGCTEPAPGRLTLAVTAVGYRPIELPVGIAAQGVTRAGAELFSRPQVHGMVQAAVRPLDDARVTLIDAAGDVMATATTGEDGGSAFSPSRA